MLELASRTLQGLPLDDNHYITNANLCLEERPLRPVVRNVIRAKDRSAWSICVAKYGEKDVIRIDLAALEQVSLVFCCFHRKLRIVGGDDSIAVIMICRTTHRVLECILQR